MMFYMQDPMELLNNVETPERIDFQLPSGGILSTEAVSPNQVRIVDLISTDPMDYMNANLQPGSIMKLSFNL